MLLDDVVAYISATTSHGFVDGTNLYKIPWPEMAPSSCGVVIEYGGLESVKAFGDQNIIFEQPRFQFNVRSTSFEDGRSAIDSVYRALDGLANTVLSTGSNSNYSYIRALSPPFYLMHDENGRPIFTCNFECVKEVG